MAICYKNQPSAYHQARVDELDPQTWRLVALNVSGDRSNPGYTAVWVPRTGPAWRAVHGVAEADYQQVVDRMNLEGFQPVLVTASGAPGQVVFAAIFAANQIRTYARHGLRLGDEADSDTLQNAMKVTRGWGFVPQSVAVYGDAFNPTFAAVWTLEPNRSWAWWWGPLPAYQGVFTAMLHSGLLPRQVAVNAFARLAVFTDDHLGRWWANHDMAEGDYQQSVDQAARESFRPIAVQSGFDRYAATFAADDLPYAKTWRVDGPDLANTAALDDAIQTVMREYRIRSASIAVAQAGTPYVKRAYTLAESDYPTVDVGTRFRVASVSKLFVTAAVQQLADQGALSLDDSAFGYLSMNKALPHDPLTDTITIRQCATAMSGLPHDFEEGVTFRHISVGLGRQADIFDLAAYIYHVPLASPPGTEGYSNSAFHVLGAVVEKASGRSLVDYVNEQLARPLGIHDIASGRTAWDQRLRGEVAFYEDVSMGVSQLNLTAEVMEASQYGGDILLDSAPGTGGLVASPISVARFLGSHHAYGLGSRGPGAARYGTLTGTSAGAASDAVWDLAFAANREVSDDVKTRLLDTVRAYLTANGAVLKPFDADEAFPLRGVLLVGGFRAQKELNAMNYEDMRNTLIVELTNRTSDSDYQRYDNVTLTGIGASLVFLRWTGSRDDVSLKSMTADDIRNTFIVEMDAVTGLGNELQRFSTWDLALIALGSDLAVRGRVPGVVSSWLRGVLLLGGFRTQRELNAMTHDDMRNTLIVELTNRTRQSDYQADNDAALEAAGALLVFLRAIGARDDATLKTMSVDDLRNTVIVELDAQTRLGRLSQGWSNLELIQTALGNRPVLAG